MCALCVRVVIVVFECVFVFVLLCLFGVCLFVVCDAGVA